MASDLTSFGSADDASARVFTVGVAGDFPTNYISTTKYNLVTFLPKNLFEQFRKVVNQYFLAICVLQLVPSISPLSPVTSIMPLVFVLTVSAIKEGLEDFGRHRSDVETNARATRLLRHDDVGISSSSSPSGRSSSGGRNSSVDDNGTAAAAAGDVSASTWRDVRVGAVVKVLDGEYFPADLLCVSTSNEAGICYIETSNLDGETNLKTRVARPESADLVDPGDVAAWHPVVRCEQPNNSLYTFNGNIMLPAAPPAGASPALAAACTGERVALSPENLLLRGAKLCNTSWLYGIVVFTGRDTKVMRNLTQPPSKRSALDRLVDRQVLIIFAVQFMLATIGAVLASDWTRRYVDRNWYLGAPETGAESSHNAAFTGFLRFFTFVILFNTMVPISLIVSIEIVKVAQAYLINKDETMYHAETKTFAQARTSSLNEELGQVKYVFSDKTGTLTRNEMEFRLCSVNGNVYSATEDVPLLPGSTAATTEGGSGGGGGGGGSSSATSGSAAGPAVLPVSRMFQDLATPGNESGQRLREFLTLLAVCHTVVPSEPEADKAKDTSSSSPTGNDQGGDRADDQGCDRGNTDSPNDSNNKGGDGAQAQAQAQAGKETDDSPGRYPANHPRDMRLPRIQAESPDEEALVVAASRFGFVLLSRTSSTVTFYAEGEVRTYTILQTLAFTSSRKRMSIICRCPDGAIRILTKGADNVILARLAKADGGTGQGQGQGQDQQQQQQQQQHADPTVATTLSHLSLFATCGLRTLCLASGDISEQDYTSWAAGHDDAQCAITDRDELLAASAERIERNLRLLGATGIEDRLQDGVPEAVRAIREGGVRVWVLTGDRWETAVNIGFSCGLLARGMTLLGVGGDPEGAPEEEQQQTEGIDDDDGAPSSSAASSSPATTTTAAAAKKPPNKPSKPKSDIVDEESVEDALDEALAVIAADDAAEARAPGVATRPSYALVIDGQSLEHALSPHLSPKLLQLGLRCESVVCCRVSPLQKALVVSLVKNSQHCVTLAIGDGANDVSMIRAAHLGIGISGHEGMQAALASDYSIAQFRFLVPLMMVHGRWSYQRLSRLILYSFYKNMAFSMTQFWYAFYSAFSGQTLYDSWLLAVFNVTSSAVPIMVFALFDQDIDRATALAHPRLYASGPREEAFNRTLLVKWLAAAVLHSLAMFFLPLYLLESEILGPSGRTAGLWTQGFVGYTCAIVVVNCKVALETRYWTVYNHLAVWGTIAYWFVFMSFYSAIPAAPAVFGIAQHLLPSPAFWFTVAIVCAASLLPDYLAKALEREICPQPVHIFQERMRIRDNSAARGRGSTITRELVEKDRVAAHL
jgi:magnesium-transporting ATPase (P-type)